MNSGFHEIPFAPRSESFRVSGWRVCFLSPHPDDVELSCAATIRRLLSAGCTVSYCCLTNGAPSAEIFAQIGQLRQGYDALAYEQVRKAEARVALAHIGMDPARILFWRYPDLETHHHIASIARQLDGLLNAFDAVLCCPFEGGHPDHDVLRFCLETALSRMPCRLQLIEYASYNRKGWQVFMDPRSTDIEVVLESKEELDLKGRIAGGFETQAEDVARFSRQFERFRIVETQCEPPERFLTPHIEPYYERFAYSQDVVRQSIASYLKLPWL